MEVTERAGPRTPDGKHSKSSKEEAPLTDTADAYFTFGTPGLLFLLDLRCVRCDVRFAG